MEKYQKQNKKQGVKKMSYQYLPYEDYTYYIDSFNNYHFNVIVPYGTYSYSVEVLSPVLPTVEETTVVPIVSLKDVKKWVNNLEGHVDTEDSALFPLFLLLRDIAKEVIVYELCGSDNMYIRAVSYYVGHYMELHTKTLKDQENKMTMSPQTKDEVESDTLKQITMLDSHYGNYKQTVWGQMFWTVYGHLSKFDLGYGVY
jgi:asparagine synthetase B (glutamine-hydrolysing)